MSKGQCNHPHDKRRKSAYSGRRMRIMDELSRTTTHEPTYSTPADPVTIHVIERPAVAAPQWPPRATLPVPKYAIGTWTRMGMIKRVMIGLGTVYYSVGGRTLHESAVDAEVLPKALALVPDRSIVLYNAKRPCGGALR